MKSNDSLPRKRKRVFLVDQSPVARLVAAQHLQQTPGMAVCGHADNSAVALAAIRQLKPDIVVTDILHDLAFIKTLHRRHPRLPILVFSSLDEAQYAPRALEAGADGYVLKDVSGEHLVKGIRGVLEGRLVLSPKMRYRLLAKCVRHGHCPCALPKKAHRRLARRRKTESPASEN
ncbi:MAG: response regulator transcription factor [Limisphaerales bacterium]